MATAEGQHVKGIKGEEEQKAFSGNSRVKSQDPLEGKRIPRVQDPDCSCFVSLKLATGFEGLTA